MLCLFFWLNMISCGISTVGRVCDWLPGS